MLVLALVAVGFVGSFLLSLVLPNLIAGDTGASALSIKIGVQNVRLVLFFASCVFLFGIGPYLIYNFYKIMRLEATTTHYIRNKLQIVILDIENASMLSKDPETTKLLSHAFQACEDMVENLPKRIDSEAPRFNVPAEVK
jgi:hypothetical protein